MSASNRSPKMDDNGKYLRDGVASPYDKNKKFERRYVSPRESDQIEDASYDTADVVYENRFVKVRSSPYDSARKNQHQDSAPSQRESARGHYSKESERSSK